MMSQRPLLHENVAGMRVAKRLLDGRIGTSVLVVDRKGKIVRCDGTTERIFGIGCLQLRGRWVSEFVTDLFLGGSSPSYSERYLAYLCADGRWRKFEGKDVDGRQIVVELRLSRTVADGQDSFLLRLRSPFEIPCA